MILVDIGDPATLWRPQNPRPAGLCARLSASRPPRGRLCLKAPTATDVGGRPMSICLISSEIIRKSLALLSRRGRGRGPPLRYPHFRSACTSRSPRDHQQSPHVPRSPPGSDRGWLAGWHQDGAAAVAGVPRRAGVAWRPGRAGRYAEGFCFCEEFSSNTRTSLHERKNLRNTGRASLTGLSGSGCRAVRGW